MIFNLELLTVRPPESDQAETIRPPGGVSVLPPLLFIHGAYCGAGVWGKHFLPFFAARGFTAHALSLRGHGASPDRRLLPWYGLNDYVADVAAALDQIKPTPVLIGHSLGGLVVQRLLARRTDLPAAVLMASVPPDGMWAQVCALAISEPEVLLQLTILQSLGPEAANLRVLQRVMFSPQTPQSDIDAMTPLLQTESLRAITEINTPWLTDLGLWGASRCRTNTATRRPPLLILGGERDLLVPPARIHATAKTFGVTATVLPGMAHAMMIDAGWLSAAQTIAAWLETVLVTES